MASSHRTCSGFFFCRIFVFFFLVGNTQPSTMDNYRQAHASPHPMAACVSAFSAFRLYIIKCIMYMEASNRHRIWAWCYSNTHTNTHRYIPHIEMNTRQIDKTHESLCAALYISWQMLSDRPHIWHFFTLSKTAFGRVCLGVYSAPTV